MSTADLLNAFIPLIVIFGLLYAVLFFVKRFSFTSKAKVSKNLDVSLVSNQMIMPKKYISVVKVKDKLLVLGICDTSINLLKELDYDESMEPDITNETGASNFLDMLKKNLTSR